MEVVNIYDFRKCLQKIILQRIDIYRSWYRLEQNVSRFFHYFQKKKQYNSLVFQKLGSFCVHHPLKVVTHYRNIEIVKKNVKAILTVWVA